MSIPITIYWAPINPTGVAPLQDVAGGENLVLNSSLVSLPQGPFIYDKVIRTISFYSANNLSGATFTITGIGSPVDVSGNPTAPLSKITENRAGPNNDNVDSLNVYSQIISISTNVAVNGISVGFGESGITDYVFMDYNRISFQCAAQAYVTAPAGGPTITANYTLTKPQTANANGQWDNMPVLPAFSVVNFTDVTVSTYAPVPLSTVVWSTVRDTTNVPFYFTVLQQAIT